MVSILVKSLEIACYKHHFCTKLFLRGKGEGRRKKGDGGGGKGGEEEGKRGRRKEERRRGMEERRRGEEVEVKIQRNLQAKPDIQTTDP